MRRGYANAASGASTERHSWGKFMRAVSKKQHSAVLLPGRHMKKPQAEAWGLLLIQ